MSKNLIKILGAAAVLALVIFLLVKLNQKSQPAAVDVGPGIAKLRELESKDAAAVDQELKEIRLQKLRASYDEELDKIRSGEKNVWSLFEDYVICGDSRAVGFWFYDFIPEDNCYTAGGATIKTHLVDIMGELAYRQPANVFLLYGLNDVSIGFWDTPEEYIADYEEILKELHEELPHSRFYLSSILPARGAALDLEYTWYFIPDFSEAVKAMCDHLDYCYFVDCSDICDEYADLWETDGIHVRREFYTPWATELMVAQFQSEMPDYQ